MLLLCLFAKKREAPRTSIQLEESLQAGAGQDRAVNLRPLIDEARRDPRQDWSKVEAYVLKYSTNRRLASYLLIVLIHRGRRELPVDIVRKCLDKEGMRPSKRNRTAFPIDRHDDVLQMTCLGAACMTGNEKVVSLLIEYGANVNLPMTVDERYPVHCAINTKVVEILCAHGADINSRDRKGQTALHKAVLDKQEWYFAQYLLQLGADVSLSDEVPQSRFSRQQPGQQRRSSRLPIVTRKTALDYALELNRDYRVVNILDVDYQLLLTLCSGLSIPRLVERSLFGKFTKRMVESLVKSARFPFPLCLQVGDDVVLAEELEVVEGEGGDGVMTAINEDELL